MRRMGVAQEERNLVRGLGAGSEQLGFSPPEALLRLCRFPQAPVKSKTVFTNPLSPNPSCQLSGSL